MNQTIEANSPGAKTSLSVMMFLQYAVWGVWAPILANYLAAPASDGGLGFSEGQKGWILGLAASIGAITAPFVAGQVADRYLNAERALALLLTLGGVLIFAAASAHNYFVFLALFVAYSIVYMPTLTLTNSISFQNLPDREKQFPLVRMWGTFGWIAIEWIFPLVWLSAATVAANTARIADALRFAGILSVCYAAFAYFVLPRTPPKRDVENPLAFVRAFGLIRHRGFLIITLIALPISMIHTAYYIRIGPFFQSVSAQMFGEANAVKWIMPMLTIGQASEMIFLALLAIWLKRIGYKRVLLIGAGAYVLRYFIFSLETPPWLMIVAQAMHGVCYACFIACAFMYVESVAPADVRHSAQSVFGIIILGLGPILASFYNQIISTDSRQFWLTQAGVALFATLALALTFPSTPVAGEVEIPSAEPVPQEL